jgi:hypothetical protein
MNAEPGGAPSLDDIMDRLRATMRENDENLEAIIRLSNISFRLWLDQTGQRLSAALGISLARVRAFLTDVRSIGLNANSAFWTSYRNEFERARKVPRVRPE